MIPRAQSNNGLAGGSLRQAVMRDADSLEGALSHSCNTASTGSYNPPRLYQLVSGELLVSPTRKDH